MDQQLNQVRGLGLSLAAYSVFAGGIWVWRAGMSGPALLAVTLHMLLAEHISNQPLILAQAETAAFAGHNPCSVLPSMLQHR